MKINLIEKEEKNINILTAFKDGGSGDGVSDALYNYIFNDIGIYDINLFLYN